MKDCKTLENNMCKLERYESDKTKTDGFKLSTWIVLLFTGVIVAIAVNFCSEIPMRTDIIKIMAIWILIVLMIISVKISKIF